MTSVSLSSCGYSAPSSEQPKPIKKIIGFFYKIKDTVGKTRGYLLGTVHVISAALNFKPEFDKKIQRSFDKSTDLITEVNLLDELHTLPSEEVFALSESYKKCPEDMMDLGFMQAALVRGMPVHGLETCQSQKELIEQCESKKLNELQKEFSSPEAIIDFLKKQQEKWIQLSSEAFEESSEEKLKTFVSESTQGVTKEIFDDRNEPMTEKIDSLLFREKGRFFITIGAGHLVGDQGICKLLEKRHWTVEKVYLSTEKPATQPSEQKDEDPIELFKKLATSLQKIGTAKQRLDDLSKLEEKMKSFVTNLEQVQRTLNEIRS